MSSKRIGRPTQLFPEISPYYEGYLNVGGEHRIYYEESGNWDGYPVIFSHGGPGGGCDEKDRRYFDPTKWRIILIDQRGCGRSRYKERLQDNNAYLLADDIATLMSARRINKAVVVGTSWGSCVTSVFAIRHPELVSGIVEGAVFLGTKEEIKYFYNGSIAYFRPQAWERFVSFVPLEWRTNPLAYYRCQIMGADGDKSSFYLSEFCLFEMSLLHLKPLCSGKKMPDINLTMAEDLVKLEMHYFINNCFLPDNYILNNAHAIADIPMSIVQGNCDMICPPLSAYKLHKALPKSTLHLVTAGHSRSDSALRKTFLREIDKMYDIVTGAA